METPFYYSFSDFEINYKIDLENFKKTYKDATEIDFYKELIYTYGMFLNFDGETFNETISVNCIFEEYPEEYDISIKEYTDLMQEKLTIYCSMNGFYDYENAFPEHAEILDYWEECNIRQRKNRNIIIDGRHKYYREFFTSNRDSIYFNNTKYKNFQYSIKKIFNFVNDILRKIEPSNNITKEPEPTYQIETPEFDFSETDDKVKLIILEKLGIIDYIKTIQTKPETISHTAEILSSFTGINSNTLYTYLRPMICPERDDDDKNSPYKNTENIYKANNKITNFKIKKNINANNLS